jgi:hypothetical protein
MDLGCTVRDGTGTIKRKKAAQVLGKWNVRLDRHRVLSTV